MVLTCPLLPDSLEGLPLYLCNYCWDFPKRKHRNFEHCPVACQRRKPSHHHKTSMCSLFKFSLPLALFIVFARRSLPGFSSVSYLDQPAQPRKVYCCSFTSTFSCFLSLWRLPSFTALFFANNSQLSLEGDSQHPKLISNFYVSATFYLRRTILLNEL